MNRNHGCIVCSSPLKRGLFEWHSYCPKCGYECTDFQPSINVVDAHAKVDEAGREEGLKRLRQANFSYILTQLDQFKLTGSNLLDVGCAHGWFLELAVKKYFALGIEPDDAVFEETKKKGFEIRNGFFPQVLSPEEFFDVIIFNDVLEHIPDPASVFRSCRSHLTDKGLLVLNLPSSDGFFYKASRFLVALGRPDSFLRLWQKDLPSPHLHYFNSENLPKLANNSGFELVHSEELPSLSSDGLFQRIMHTGDTPLWKGVLIFTLLRLALPFIKIFKSDIILQIYRINQSLLKQ